MTEQLFKGALIVAERFGWGTVILIFLIWRGDARETELRDEMMRDRTFQRDTLVDILQQNTAALSACNQMLARSGVAQQERQ